MQGRRVKFINQIAYGIGDLYGGGAFFIISTFSMYFLINVVGLNPILASLVPGLGKIWDAISDPLMGYITDNTKSKFGRRRVFFLIAIFPIAITFILMWLPVNFSSQLALFLYYFIAYLLFYTVFTMTLVPYSALSAEMTTDFTERNRLSGTRMIFSMLSTLIAGVAVEPIINMFSDPSRGHFIMSIIFGLFYAIPWIFVFLGTWELPYVKKEEEQENIFKSFLSIFRNKSFRIHIIMYIASYAAMDTLMAWLKFYLIDYLNRPNFISIGLGAILLTQIFFLPVYIIIANKKGHSFAYKIGLSIWILATIIFSFQKKDSSFSFLVFNCILIGMGLSAGVLIPWTILPFTTDIDILITGKKRAGTYSGAMTLIRKLIQGALVIPMLGLLLNVINYRNLTTEESLILKSLKSINNILKTENLNEKHFMKLISNSETILKNLDLIKDYDKRIAITSEEIKNVLKEEVNNTLNYSKSRDIINMNRENIITKYDLFIQKFIITQSQDTLYKLRVLFISIPIILLAIGIIVSFGFKLNAKTHKILMDEINRLENKGDPSQVKDDVKKICEELTGIKYEELALVKKFK